MITTSQTELGLGPNEIADVMVGDLIEAYTGLQHVAGRAVDAYRHFEMMTTSVLCTGVRIVSGAAAAVLSVPIWYAKNIAKLLWELPLVRQLLGRLAKPAAKASAAADAALSWVERAAISGMVAASLIDAAVADWFGH